ncbi:cob(I)yrinic acid a,c-diamide adenosyltransferase [Anaerotignum lactatifermentans]|uniref:Cob(I)yrinic acid a,c-diamide adenosyltransferase n=1 Tax=Anaerotignum lactatifermentans TaxID=160404 RepID=A0ABS2G8U4_9FIRM|nr:cob(I)yrinic acid a,c-diamide adenosyltransferase [Anaerotignum lactatifermentans]MBM6877610.1 cob(I)yrinic acid a,c-diamide adenosyltransferase [Anaerotignum lactatifermentans]MBM6949913.1 cob(I)yrinic acid a,c-diamide adenosyltransferase [Anaerotignum lactatifermentans]
MKQGQISVYYGAGKGKTCVALGRGLRALGEDLRVVMIQFMDYHSHKEMALLEKLEPDFRVFHFEKNRTGEVITEEIRKEIAGEIRNAYNFAKKILDTGECEMLMLDGILECVEEGFLPETDVVALMEKRPENMDMILTGSGLPGGVAERANSIYQIVPEK